MRLPILRLFKLAGEAVVGTKQATGSVTGQQATASGTAIKIALASGSVQGQQATVSNTAIQIQPASGSIQGQQATVSGTATLLTGTSIIPIIVAHRRFRS